MVKEDSQLHALIYIPLPLEIQTQLQHPHVGHFLSLVYCHQIKQLGYRTQRDKSKNMAKHSRSKKVKFQDSKSSLSSTDESSSHQINGKGNWLETIGRNLKVL